MYKRKLLAVVLLSFTLLTGFAGLGDYEIPLVGGYEIWGYAGGKEIVYIGDHAGVKKVTGHKTSEVGWDDQFIYAKSGGTDEAQYYMINYKTHVVYGPIDEEALHVKKKELDIIHTVVMKDIRPQSLVTNH
ncbi:hypothetical protein FZW96_07400 [Bacillus sp. BGMRC 2118]|nr:hypothetical protein FZW96_07400 [Bacillus sp. BGMRC 2118]